jgi:hypothetical protein
LDCEDEVEFSVRISIPNEVNVIDPGKLSGVSGCGFLGQFRGVLRFTMPNTGFLWSHISQQGAHFKENFPGYNLDDNDFIRLPEA